MITPSDSISVAGHSYPQRRQDARYSSSSRQRSTSSALDFRMRPTTESCLERPTRVAGLDSRRPRSSNSSHDRHRETDTATLRGKHRRASNPDKDGKICLHTHHHHYWIVPNTAREHEAIPNLRSSRERILVQQAGVNNGFDGHMDFWPSEGRIEALAEYHRPHSRNTTDRYFIEG